MNFQALRDAAVAHYGSEQRADAFMEGMYKSASLFGGQAQGDLFGGGNPLLTDKGEPITGTDLAGSFVNNGVGAIGKGLGGLVGDLVVKGVGSVLGSANKSMQRTAFLKALEHAIQTNRILKAADKDKVMSYAETVFKYAPSVSSDANFLSSILANAVHGEGIDSRTIQMLTEIEGKHSMNGRNPLGR